MCNGGRRKIICEHSCETLFCISVYHYYFYCFFVSFSFKFDAIGIHYEVSRFIAECRACVSVAWRLKRDQTYLFDLRVLTSDFIRMAAIPYELHCDCVARLQPLATVGHIYGANAFSINLVFLYLKIGRQRKCGQATRQSNAPVSWFMGSANESFWPFRAMVYCYRGRVMAIRTRNWILAFINCFSLNSNSFAAVSRYVFTWTKKQNKFYYWKSKRYLS